jgi:hypothetical protein
LATVGFSNRVIARDVISRILVIPPKETKHIFLPSLRAAGPFCRFPFPPSPSTGYVLILKRQGWFGLTLHNVTVSLFFVQLGAVNLAGAFAMYQALHAEEKQAQGV